MKLRYLYILPIAALMGAMAACDDDDTEYVWGEADSADCMGVYFDANNDEDFIFEPEETAQATITLHRKLTTAAVDVPLTLTSDIDGVAIPSTASFAAGVADCDILLDFSGIPQKQLVSFKISIPDEYYEKYSLNYFNYESTVIISAWENANEDGSPVKFYYTDKNYISYPNDSLQSVIYEPVESVMEVLPGASKIRIYNFMNTGVELMTFQFTKSPYASYDGYYRIYPADDNYITFVDAYESDTYGDDWDNPWFVFNYAENDYVAAELKLLSDGSDSEFGWPYFFSYSDTDSYESSYMYPKGSEFEGEALEFSAVSMYAGGTPDGQITLPTYLYLYFRWDGESGL